jgi:hypothetical protein
MKRLLAAGAIFFAAAAAFAFNPDAASVPAGRIGIIQAEGGARGTGALARALRDELRRAGADARVLPDSIEELRESDLPPDVDLLVEVEAGEAESTAWGAIGGGTRVGHVCVGGEIGVVHTSAAAVVRIYDATDLEEIEEFEVSGDSASPAITSISIGDPYGLFWFELPVFRRGSAARVSRLIAKDAAQQIVKRGTEER